MEIKEKMHSTQLYDPGDAELVISSLHFTQTLVESMYILEAIFMQILILPR